jgi:hypothetical protein
MLAPATSRGKMTITVKARSIHRARELALELQGWSSSSLREVLLTCGVWEEGMRCLAPDNPRIVTVWGDPLENGSLPLGTNQEESSNTFAKWIRALFDKHRTQRDGVGGEFENDPVLPEMEQMDQEQALSLVKRLSMRKGRHVAILVESVERTTDGDEVGSRQDAGSELGASQPGGNCGRIYVSLSPEPTSTGFLF